MSKLFDKLGQLNKEAPISTPMQGGRFPFILTLGTVAAFGAMFFLGVLASNETMIKSKILARMDKNIQQQQDQISSLNAKLLTIQTSINDRFQKEESTTQDLNNNVQAKISDLNSSVGQKFDDLNNNVELKINTASKRTDRIKAMLQTKIDELSAKLDKFQASIPETSPNTGDQINAVTPN
jgi:hypothetical protein